MRTFYKLSCSVLLLLARIMFTPSVSAQAPTVAPGRVFAEPQPSTGYAENVTNIHWRRGNGTNYIVLIREKDNYSGAPVAGPATPGLNAGAIPTANGRMESATRVAYSPNPFNATSLTYVLRAGTYGSAADTTAAVLNAQVGMYYEVTVFEYNAAATTRLYTNTSPVEFRQPRITPRITRTSLSSLNAPIITFQVPAEFLTSAIYVSWSTDSTRSSLMPVQVPPVAVNTTGHTYSAELPLRYTGGPLYIHIQLLSFFRPTLGELRETKAFLFSGIFSSFQAQPASSTGSAGTKLDWAVAFERGNVGFQVQRSLDSLTWSNVVLVPSRGDSPNQEAYTYTTATSSSSYYRILQLGHGQVVTGISPLQRVIGTALAAAPAAAAPVFGAYPNPASTQLHLDALDRDHPVQLLNSLGQLVRQQQPGQALSAVHDLPRGMYVLRQGSRSTRITLE